MELKVPVIVTSQLSRATEQSEKSKPKMSHLRESGAIEQDADMVILLYRKGYYDKESGDKTADIDLAKQRSGPTGDFQLIFNAESTSFENMAYESTPKAEVA